MVIHFLNILPIWLESKGDLEKVDEGLIIPKSAVLILQYGECYTLYKNWAPCSTDQACTDLNLNFHSPSPPPLPLPTASINSLAITGFVIQLSKHQPKTKLNEGRYAHLIFSAVFGTTSANNSIFILPTSYTCKEIVLWCTNRTFSCTFIRWD